MSEIMLESQYAGKLTPEITCMCLSCISRSLMMKEMMTHGISAKAMDVMMPKSRACPSAMRDLNTASYGKGAVTVLNCFPLDTVASMDW